MPEASSSLVPAALTWAVADEMAALVLLHRGKSVPTLVLSELSAQFSDQLRSLGLGPAGKPRPHPFGGRDRPALPQDLAYFLVAKLLDLLDQLDRIDLETRGRITATVVAFAQDVIGEFLADDVRQEEANQSALDECYANGGDDDDGSGGSEPPPPAA